MRRFLSLPGGFKLPMPGRSMTTPLLAPCRCQRVCYWACNSASLACSLASKS
jgi:hypothetical protein